MKIIVILMFVQCLMTVNGIQYSRSSNLLKKYTCLEEINVIYITLEVLRLKDDLEIHDFLTYLEDPCIKISFYDNKLDKVVQWKSEQPKIDLSSNRYSPPFLDLLESFYDNRKLKGNASTKQILLIDVPVSISHKMREAIEFLENKTKWNVILLCLPSYCPITIRLPIHLLVPYWNEYHFIRRYVKLHILNPDFDKFQFLEYIKFYNDEKLTYLANETMRTFSHLLK